MKERHIFRFADLPAEIRNQIYKLSLTTDEQVHLTLDQNGKRHMVVLDEVYDYSQQCYKPASGLNPNLLLINKATYFEGGPILYGNKFYINYPMTLYIFLTYLSATSKSWIQDLTFDFESPPTDQNVRKAEGFEYLHLLLPAFIALIGTTDLKHLHLQFEAEWYTGKEADDFPEKFYEDAYIWLEELVRQKGSKEMAVGILDVWLCPEDGCIAGKDSRSTSILHERLVRFLS